EPVQPREASFAVAADRLGAAVRHPRTALARHAALGDDAGAPGRACTPERSCEQALVVAELVLAAAVTVRGVEDGDPGLDRGRDRRDRARLVAVLVGRETHAAETDAELGFGEPAHDSTLAGVRHRS